MIIYGLSYDNCKRMIEGIKQMYYTYMLRCKDKSIYAGITTDVERRLEEHVKKSEKGAKYTRSHDAIKMEAIWESKNRADASKLEYWIKHLTKKQKERLIKEDCLEILEDKIVIDNYNRI